MITQAAFLELLTDWSRNEWRTLYLLRGDAAFADECVIEYARVYILQLYAVVIDHFEVRMSHAPYTLFWPGGVTDAEKDKRVPDLSASLGIKRIVCAVGFGSATQLHGSSNNMAPATLPRWGAQLSTPLITLSVVTTSRGNT